MSQVLSNPEGNCNSLTQTSTWIHSENSVPASEFLFLYTVMISRKIWALLTNSQFEEMFLFSIDKDMWADVSHSHGLDPKFKQKILQYVLRIPVLFDSKWFSLSWGWKMSTVACATWFGFFFSDVSFEGYTVYSFGWFRWRWISVSIYFFIHFQHSRAKLHGSFFSLFNLCLFQNFWIKIHMPFFSI
jgi:hypothetical protein